MAALQIMLQQGTGHVADFDRIGKQFQRNIYGGLKGRLRLDILREDLSCPEVASCLAHAPRILDAGCGSAPLSLSWLNQASDLLLLDRSQQMLDMARSEWLARNPGSSAAHCRLLCGALPDQPPPGERFEFILLHAVLEWNETPHLIFQRISSLLAPGGLLSVTFYNLHGYILRRALQGNVAFLEPHRPRPYTGDLTPVYPLTPEEVIDWGRQANLRLVLHSGLRCFSDYRHPAAAKQSYESLLDIERRFSRRVPFRDIARYQHLLFVQGTRS